MQQLTKTSKITVSPDGVRFRILKYVVDWLGITPKDRLRFVLGSVDGCDKLQILFNFARKENRSIVQPPLLPFENMVSTYVGICKCISTSCLGYTSVRFQVYIPCKVCSRHRFVEGDRIRWTLDIDEDEVKGASIEYISEDGA